MCMTLRILQGHVIVSFLLKSMSSGSHVTMISGSKTNPLTAGCHFIHTKGIFPEWTGWCSSSRGLGSPLACGLFIPPPYTKSHQVHPLCRYLAMVDIHIRMTIRKPDFLDVTNSSPRTSHIATMSIHLQKVLWHEFNSTFIKSKHVSEVTCVGWCGGHDVDNLLNEAQWRHCISGQCQLTMGMIKRLYPPDAHKMNPHTPSTKIPLELHHRLGILGSMEM